MPSWFCAGGSWTTSTPIGAVATVHLNVVLNLELGDNLDEAAVARLLDGPPLDSVALRRRMLCDASLHRYVTDGLSTVLDYGRTTHTIFAAVWAALGIRDEHCRFPGCDRPITWCEAHHVRPWSKGGPTNLRNLCLLCSRHHHLVHRSGWVLGPAGQRRRRGDYPRRPHAPEQPAQCATATAEVVGIAVMQPASRRGILRPNCAQSVADAAEDVEPAHAPVEPL